MNLPEFGVGVDGDIRPELPVGGVLHHAVDGLQKLQHGQVLQRIGLMLHRGPQHGGSQDNNSRATTQGTTGQGTTRQGTTTQETTRQHRGRQDGRTKQGPQLTVSLCLTWLSLTLSVTPGCLWLSHLTVCHTWLFLSLCLWLSLIVSPDCLWLSVSVCHTWLSLTLWVSVSGCPLDVPDCLTWLSLDCLTWLSLSVSSDCLWLSYLADSGCVTQLFLTVSPDSHLCLSRYLWFGHLYGDVLNLQMKFCFWSFQFQLSIRVDAHFSRSKDRLENYEQTSNQSEKEDLILKKRPADHQYNILFIYHFLSSWGKSLSNLTVGM